MFGGKSGSGVNTNTQPGGRVPLVAECEEGFGASELTQVLKALPPDLDFCAHIERAPVIVGWQYEKV